MRRESESEVGFEGWGGALFGLWGHLVGLGCLGIWVQSRPDFLSTMP